MKSLKRACIISVPVCKVWAWEVIYLRSPLINNDVTKVFGSKGSPWGVATYRPSLYGIA